MRGPFDANVPHTGRSMARPSSAWTLLLAVALLATLLLSSAQALVQDTTISLRPTYTTPALIQVRMSIGGQSTYTMRPGGHYQFSLDSSIPISEDNPVLLQWCTMEELSYLTSGLADICASSTRPQDPSAPEPFKCQVHSLLHDDNLFFRGTTPDTSSEPSTYSLWISTHP
ncbi:hypothetical protein H696_02571 [Fonticula alba]|uniref:Plastocyanin-like domain-containing protein n=1 Tax=Fonticula alba TaxID=691883 RepID=A0A058Z7Z5_FONAL|nr:hypothetical protein H696_02571 [Fonticula alba]KCV70241.1 hypothetical protein H696_02571 [Fonticula alba]|eukprot:XP_009494757.1 hypothetical protein H696_02571 [Fonticula alba]